MQIAVNADTWTGSDSACCNVSFWQWCPEGAIWGAAAATMPFSNDANEPKRTMLRSYLRLPWAARLGKPSSMRFRRLHFSQVSDRADNVGSWQHKSEVPRRSLCRCYREVSESEADVLKLT